jgi:hypothetical protein
MYKVHECDGHPSLMAHEKIASFLARPVNAKETESKTFRTAD